MKKLIQKIYYKINAEINGEFNTLLIRNKVKTALEIALGSEVKIMCDETNNSPKVIDSNVLIARLDYMENHQNKYWILTFGNVQMNWG